MQGEKKKISSYPRNSAQFYILTHLVIRIKLFVIKAKI